MKKIIFITLLSLFNHVSIFAKCGPNIINEIANSPFAVGEQPLTIAFNPTGTLLVSANFDDDNVTHPPSNPFP